MSIYVDAETNRIVRARAARDGLPIQEVVAQAINLALAARGRQPALNPTRLRVFRRVNRPAAERTSPKESRNGKITLSGWYDRKEVQSLAEHCSALGESSQVIGVAGLGLWLAQGVEIAHPLQE